MKFLTLCSQRFAGAAANWAACAALCAATLMPSIGRADQSVFLGVHAPDADQAGEGDADDVADAIQALQRGGFVVVFRHGATVSDESDEDPLVLTDCARQRNLSDWGRDTMEGLGEFLAQRQVRFAVAYSSAMCRAVDTAHRLTIAGVVPLPGITMASAGGMAKPANPDPKQSQVLRELVATVPAQGANTLVVTHAPNLVAAFGTELSGVPEGSAVVFEPRPGAAPGYVVRWRLPLWGLAGYARDLQAGAQAPAHEAGAATAASTGESNGHGQGKDL